MTLRNPFLLNRSMDLFSKNMDEFENDLYNQSFGCAEHSNMLGEIS